MVMLDRSACTRAVRRGYLADCPGDEVGYGVDWFTFRALSLAERILGTKSGFSSNRLQNIDTASMRVKNFSKT